jgi:hypothetical protein
MLHRPLIQRAGGFTPPIEQSLICDGAAYLSWTPGAASTSRRVGSLALWVRRIDFGANDRIFSSRLDSSNFLIVEFQTDNTMRVWFRIGGADYIWVTSAVFRDPGWWHLMMSWNTTTQTFLLLRNGVPLTFSSSATLPLNGDTSIYHNGARQTLSAWFDGSGHSEIFSGAIADPHMLDGTALADALDFVDGFAFDGQSIPTPKAVSGLTYGTNGAHLSFADTAAFGDDTSGNGNDWTPTGFVASDQTADVPGRPLARLNPLDRAASLMTISNGGRQAEPASLGFRHCRATLPLTVPTYWEVQLLGSSSGSPSSRHQVGVMSSAFNEIYDAGTTPASSANGAWTADGAGQTTADGVLGVDYTNLSLNDHWCLAFDPFTGNLWIRDDGAAWWGGGDPAAGTSPTLSGIPTDDLIWPLFSASQAGDIVLFKFDESDWTQTAPTGFMPLSVGSFETPLHAGKNWFDANPRTGTGSTYSVTTGPANGTDLVWTKGRSGATDHAWYDIVRGVQQQLESNTTTAETTEATGLTAFNATGYTAGALAQMNTSAATYVDWMWKAGGEGVANTDGTISGTVSVADAGHFSIVSSTGTGANGTIGHGLPGAPELRIRKQRNGTRPWGVWYKTFTVDQALYLNDTTGVFAATAWWNTLPDATVMGVGTNVNMNESGFTYIDYLFRSVPGLCKVGSYIGNGSADGPLIWLGFTPRWIMVKRVDAADGWQIQDTARTPFNDGAGDALYANTSGAESAGNAVHWEVTSDGFKLRSSNSFINASGGTYIYLAMADIAGGGELPWPLAR